MAGPSKDATKETALTKPFEVRLSPRYSAVIRRTRDSRRARTSSSRAAPAPRDDVKFSIATQNSTALLVFARRLRPTSPRPLFASLADAPPSPRHPKISDAGHRGGEEFAPHRR